MLIAGACSRRTEQVDVYLGEFVPAAKAAGGAVFGWDGGCC